MITCPKCGNKIDYLLCFTTEYNTYCFDGEDFIVHERLVKDVKFVCPECEEVVARGWREAEALLKE